MAIFLTFNSHCPTHTFVWQLTTYFQRPYRPWSAFSRLKAFRGDFPYKDFWERWYHQDINLKISFCGFRFFAQWVFLRFDKSVDYTYFSACALICRLQWIICRAHPLNLLAQLSLSKAGRWVSRGWYFWVLLTFYFASFWLAGGFLYFWGLQWITASCSLSPARHPPTHPTWGETYELCT